MVGEARRRAVRWAGVAAICVVGLATEATPHDEAIPHAAATQHAGSTPESATAPSRAMQPAEAGSLHGRPIGAIHCAGNHRTRTATVLRELLLSTGDPLDSELIAESERKLRALPFLGSATITPSPRAWSDSVDLEVRVTERWSWIPMVTPAMGGGRIDVDFYLADMNLFGRGQTLAVSGSVSNEEEGTARWSLHDPHLGGSRWRAGVSAGWPRDRAAEWSVELRRPLVSLSSRWSWWAQGYSDDSQHRLYANGYTVSKYYRRRDGGALGVTRSFRRADRRLMLTATYSFFDDRYEQASGWTGAMPDDRRRGLLQFRVTAERFAFVKERFFFNQGPVEDIRLGPRASLFAGGAARWLGADRNYPTFGVEISWWAGRPGRGYLNAGTSSSFRLERGEVTNHVASAYLRAYGRLPAHGMLAARVSGSLMDRLEVPAQLFAGSFSGVRGYEAQYHAGTRRLRANLEWRQPVKSWRLVAVGVVAFADAGMVWDAGESAEDAPTLVGTGAGLRLGFPWFYGGPVTRIDWAYGWRDDYQDISLGLGHRF